jgi:hypothetical protein
VRTCLELVSRRTNYVTHETAADIFLLSPDYDRAVRLCATEGGHSCMWTIFGLASVLRRQIISVYPKINSYCDDGFDAAVLANRSLFPLSDAFHLKPLPIMWTRVSGDGLSPWTPSHFVPLVDKQGKQGKQRTANLRTALSVSLPQLCGIVYQQIFDLYILMCS